MVGYIISNTTYSALVESFKAKAIAKQEYEYYKTQCEQLRINIQNYRLQINQIATQYLCDFRNNINYAFDLMDKAVAENDVDKYINGANIMTRQFGGQVQWNNKKEFDNFMNNNEIDII